MVFVDAEGSSGNSQVGSGLCFSSIESRLHTVYRNGLIPPRNQGSMNLDVEVGDAFHEVGNLDVEVVDAFHEVDDLDIEVVDAFHEVVNPDIEVVDGLS
jgi:hypothetical protein